jgi:FdrA protein
MVGTDRQATQRQDVTHRLRGAKGPVGVVSASKTGLWEVVGWLAREGVGVSHALVVGREQPPDHVAAAAMESGLQDLQAVPDTEIVILISEKLAVDATNRILARVRASDKPTVVCFVGESPRLAWRAGAIPAMRLDEAAMRAIAWVRGWDQALVSSQLEEEGDELARLANSLRAGLGRGPRRVRGLLTGSILRREAQLLLSDSAGSASLGDALHVARRVTAGDQRLAGALAAPDTAVVLLSLLAEDAGPDPAEIVAGFLAGSTGGDSLPTGEERGGPLVVAHLLAAGCDPQRLTAQESRLRGLGVAVAPSNASAARLAGLIIRSIER